MSKITRQTMKWFGSTAGGSDVGVFGSLAASSPTHSQVIATIQSLAAWGTGWAAEITTYGTQSNCFALEDMNAFCYVTSYGLCYLHEMGIPEWDAATVYYTYSFCQYGGVIYQSLQNTNLNQNPSTQTAWWQVYNAVDNVTLLNTAGVLSIKGATGAANAANGVVVLDANSKIPVAQLGAWAAKSDNTPYLAASDGFVVATSGGGTHAQLTIYTDASNPPTTARYTADDYTANGTTGPVSGMCPVRKGDYWKTLNAAIIYWIPLGS